MKMIKALEQMLNDLSTIEVATITEEEGGRQVVAYSKMQIDGDHLSIVLSHDPEQLEIQKKAIESAQELRYQTLDLISGIITNL